MTHQQEVHASPAGQPIRAAESGRSLKFGNDNAFQLELRRRVEEYFRTTGRRQRDCWQMYLKTAILVASFAVSSVLLVFVADQAPNQGDLKLLAGQVPPPPLLRCASAPRRYPGAA